MFSICHQHRILAHGYAAIFRTNFIKKLCLNMFLFNTVPAFTHSVGTEVLPRDHPSLSAVRCRMSLTLRSMSLLFQQGKHCRQTPSAKRPTLNTHTAAATQIFLKSLKPNCFYLTSPYLNLFPSRNALPTRSPST